METAPIDKLLLLMAALRDPKTGCPWDAAQSFSSVAPYTIEEAYEVADAIQRGDLEDLRDELGDLLLQVIFHAQIAEEAGAFGFEDVVSSILAKLIRRHPHVFDAFGNPLPSNARETNPTVVKASWERIKAEERMRKRRRAAGEGTDEPPPNPLDGIPQALPALARAEKISRKAAIYGFDWPNACEVMAKVREEADEVEQSLAEGDAQAIAEEIGDLLFSVANLARHAGVDPEDALRHGTRKFERRFTAMANHLAQQGGNLAQSDLAVMEAAWQAVKRDEA